MRTQFTSERRPPPYRIKTQRDVRLFCVEAYKNQLRVKWGSKDDDGDIHDGLEHSSLLPRARDDPLGGSWGP